MTDLPTLQALSERVQRATGPDREPQGPPEPEMIPCAKCHVPIRSLWAPGGRGLLRGEYVLVADWLFHPECWDEFVAEQPRS